MHVKPTPELSGNEKVGFLSLHTKCVTMFPRCMIDFRQLYQYAKCRKKLFCFQGEYITLI